MHGIRSCNAGSMCLGKMGCLDMIDAHMECGTLAGKDLRTDSVAAGSARCKASQAHSMLEMSSGGPVSELVHSRRSRSTRCNSGAWRCTAGCGCGRPLAVRTGKRQQRRGP